MYYVYEKRSLNYLAKGPTATSAFNIAFLLHQRQARILSLPEMDEKHFRAHTVVNQDTPRAILKDHRRYVKA